MEQGPAKPPPLKERIIVDAVKAEGRREAFQYLHELGIINYSSWDDVYFLEQYGIVKVFKYE